ncbi:uncharacterized protein BP01DRAFT_299537 [Aspergillus saccharolyticus JOP 1030-1]|uniref:Uncharacterized protein n=1 Tax=Aspergillus saccharolyticus JOP 1030-1 TaxID=1450539 RepID=A0A318Z9L2_9EURO|nr:hypothetical protein BP01DRAFT_299537 [Aspergillus saccharolyticus JOP 1030-1]PYH44036.1 hypothetical protein BP01DRAFT_299537 [Aspergillus saccharolyticus JOP 1030-1]
MHWEFVNSHDAVSATTRKRIRSHVARGKNAGKKLSRPSRLSKAHPIPTRLCIPALVHKQRAYENENDKYYIERPITDGLAFPVELAPQTRQIAQKGIAAEALRHLLRALHLLNARLAGVDSLSDDTVAAVVGMVHYERHLGHFDRAYIHVRGLRQMVNIRGGIRQLGCELSRKIFLRCDLECSIQLGRALLFSVEEVDAMSSSMVRSDLQHRATTTWPDRQRLDPGLTTLFRYATDIARIYNDIGAGVEPKLTYPAHFDILLPFGYRLLRFSPWQAARPPSLLDDLVQIGLLVFLGAFLRRLDRGITDNVLLARLLRSVADSAEVDRVTQEALLWALFVGTASIFQKDAPEWLILRAGVLMQELTLATWEDTLCLLRQFPWVNALHDAPAQHLWKRLATSCIT